MAMQTFEDDELNDVKAPAPAARSAAAAAAAPAQAQAHQPKQQPRQPVQDDFDESEPPKAAKPEEDDIYVTDFDDEKVINRPGQLNRIRPDKGRAVRIAFIPKNIVRMVGTKSHFVEIGTGKDMKQGTYRCLSPIGSDDQAYCCQKLQKDSTVHIAALVLLYKNADPTTGKYVKGADGHVPPIQWELGYVDLSPFNVKQIKKLPDEDQTSYDIDIIMTHADRAFGYEFNRASNKARWLQNPELVKEVVAAAERFRDGKTLISRLGKKLSLIEWKALLSGVSGEEAKLEDMNDL